MELTINQDDTDCVNYLDSVVKFIKKKLGSKPKQEQLESRFDILLTEYAMTKAKEGYTANYDPTTRTLTIMS